MAEINHLATISQRLHEEWLSLVGWDSGLEPVKADIKCLDVQALELPRLRAHQFALLAWLVLHDVSGYRAGRDGQRRG